MENTNSNQRIQSAIENLIKDCEPMMKRAISTLQETNQYEELETLLSSYRKVKGYIKKLPDTPEEGLENIRNLRLIFDKLRNIEERQAKSEARQDRLETRQDVLENKVDKNKKEADKEREKDKQENKQDKVSMNIKLDQIITQQQLFEQRQTSNEQTTAEGFNIAHERMNIQQRDIQDIRLDIRKVHDKLDLLKSDTRNAGAAYAKTFIQKIENAKNVPSHNYKRGYLNG